VHEPTRRNVLKWSTILLGSSLLKLPTFAAETKPRKLLFFTKSSGFEHSVIKRKGDSLGYAEQLLIDLGKPHNLDITASKDGRFFTRERLAELDAVIFYTTENLTESGTDKQPPMSIEGKQALLDAVHNGLGFVGIHCATDTFHSPPDKIDPYIAMLGGEFIVHGKQQDATQHVADAHFPGVGSQSDFTLHEEWYALKDFADDLHVILAQQTKGMSGDMYARPPYPSTWARMHGKGRVFYTSMGHREDVWANPIFQNLLLGGINWSIGAVDADVTPNLRQTTPGAMQIPTTNPTK
jgi:type 1 glutamine amidotransferase